MRQAKTAVLLLAGSFFFLGCHDGKVRKGVTVDGVEVGGMPYHAAEELLRSRLPRLPLLLRAGEAVYPCPIDYADDISRILRDARVGGRYTSTVRRMWVTMEDSLDMVCRNYVKEPKNAELSFENGKFSYTSGAYGTACDYHVLIERVTEALRTGETEVELPLRRTSPAVTEEDLRARTRLLAAFSTQYDESKEGRSKNISLAAEYLSGAVLGSCEVLSFNERVGERTRERGFCEAPVIVQGRYETGVGGGVCQVSSTLFGAALRAGLIIEESHAHSLSVGYVPPSQDAMVSSSSDLKISNPYPVPVYLYAEAGGGRVTVSLYGLPDGRRYEVETEVLLRMAPPPEQVIEGTEDRVLRAPHEGIASESRLLVYEGDVLLSRTRIRRDSYACVQGIVERISHSRAE